MPSDQLKALARKLVERNNSQQIDRLLAEDYHPDCLSIEAFAMPGQSAEAKGMEAIKAKHAWWESTFEVHSMSATGPFFNGDEAFAVLFHADTTHKETGERSQMEEIALYTVKDGKIVQERFFYDC